MSSPIDPVAPYVRPMVVDDLDAVVAIERSAAPHPWSRELFAEDLVAVDRFWLVAGPQPTVVGFAGAMQVVDEAHILNIAVDPRFQRRGVATALLSATLSAVVKNGAVAATLEVRSDNSSAIALYRRFGFIEKGCRPGYYKDGGDGLIMWAHDLAANVSGIGAGTRGAP